MTEMLLPWRSNHVLLTMSGLNRNQYFLRDFSMRGARAAIFRLPAVFALPGRTRTILVGERWF
jgi:hypothetical protein